MKSNTYIINSKIVVGTTQVILKTQRKVTMQLEYIISGKSEKETILFVHGAGANASQFEKQHKHLSDRYKVVSLSLRGHGLSALPSKNLSKSYSLEENANDIIELIVRLNLDRIHYVGNSAGGVLGYIVCTKLKDRILSLTTFGTTGRMTLPRWSASLVSAFDSVMIRFLKLRYLRFTSNLTGINDESREAIYQMFLKATEAIPYLRANLVNYNFLSEIEKLPIPYRLIQCEFDKDINKMLRTTIEAMSKNKNAKVIYFEGAGHIANLDKPDEFNQLILNIVTELSPLKNQKEK